MYHFHIQFYKLQLQDYDLTKDFTEKKLKLRTLSQNP